MNVHTPDVDGRLPVPPAPASPLPLDITQATLNKFLAIETDLLDHKLISKYGNYRNLQPRNGRTLYYSPGVQTAPCTVAAREPHFACDTEMGRTKLEIALAVLFAVVCPQAPRLLIVSSCMQSSGN